MNIKDWPPPTTTIIGLVITNERLREALLRYGQHDDECAIVAGAGCVSPPRPCTCGLSVVLKGDQS